MKRVRAVLALVGLGVAAVAPLAPRVVLASSQCSQPTVSGISVGGAQQQFGPAGSQVTVTGSNFTTSNVLGTVCNKLQVSFGSNAPSFTVTASSSTQFSFTSAAGMSGQLSVAAVDNQNPPQATAADNHLVYITTPSSSGLSNTKPYTSTTVQLNGSGFNFHLPSGWEQYSSAYACSSGIPTSAPSYVSDAQLNVAMPSQYCNGSVSVTIAAPCDTSQPTARCMTFTLPAASFDIAPHVVSLGGSATAGQIATVNGSGFGPNGPTEQVTVNGTSASVTSWRDTAVSFVIPASSTSGNVQLTRPADGQGFSAGSLGVNATITSMSPQKAAVGDTVTVNGAGFGSPAGSVTVNGTSANVSSWSASQVVFTVPSGATSGPVVVSTNGTNPPGAVNLQVIPRITGVTPTHAAPGDVIEVDGTTFGTSQGTATIAGQPATVTLWGDTSVIVQVPNVSSQNTTVTVSPPGNDSASTPFHVDAPPPPPSSGASSSSSSSSSGGQSSGSGSSSSSSSSSSTAAPTFIAPNPSGPVIVHGSVPFVHAPPPPGPVSLRLSDAANQADPGASVTFTVTLKAFGKPVAGAPVDLLLVIEPGSDATISPAHAVTDANGQVTGTIHLSKTAGDHIVLARSGIYSDEIRVVGRGATEAAASAGAGGSGSGAPTSSLLAVRSPVLWALISCLLLFGIGFGLNLVTSPAVAGAPGVAGTRSGTGAGAPRGLRESFVVGLGLASEAARFVAGVVAVLGASVVGALRELRGPRSSL